VTSNGHTTKGKDKRLREDHSSFLLSLCAHLISRREKVRTQRIFFGSLSCKAKEPKKRRKEEQKKQENQRVREEKKRLHRLFQKKNILY
jgi:hypothetical protein